MLAIALLLLATSARPGPAPVPASGFPVDLRVAHRALEQGRLDDARLALDRCAARSPENATVAYYRACVDARAGQVEDAMANLRTAVERGLEDHALLAWDPDLAPLLSEPAFVALLDDLRNREPSEAAAPRLQLVRSWSVWNPQLSRDGTRLLTSGSAAFLRDVETDECLSVFAGGFSRVSAAFVNSDRHVATLGDGALRLWDARTGAFEREVLSDAQGALARTDPEGRLFVVDAEGVDRVYRTEDWFLLSEQLNAGWTLPLSDGETVIHIGYFGKIELVRLDPHNAVARWNVGPLLANSWEVSLDERRLAVRNAEDELRVFDLVKGLELGRRDVSEYAVHSFVPGRETILLSAKGRFVEWDFVRDELVGACDLPAAARSPRLVASPDGRWIVAVATSDSWILERATGRTVRRLLVGGFDFGTSWTERGLVLGLPDSEVHLLSGEAPFVHRVFGDLVGWGTSWSPRTDAVAFHPHRPTAYVPGRDRSVRSLDLPTGRIGVPFDAGSQRKGVSVVAVDPTGKRLATASKPGGVTIWSLDTREVERYLAAGYRTCHDALRLSFDPTGRYLLTCGAEARPVLWDVETGEAVARIDLAPEQARCVAWAPDGASFAIGGADEHEPMWKRGGSLGTLSVFGRDGKQRGGMMLHDSEVLCLAYAPDGSCLAAGSSGMATLWDVSSREPLHNLWHDRIGKLVIPWVVFSPDGSRIVTTSRKWSTARCWDVESGRRLWTVDFDEGNPATLEAYFSPDGQHVYLGGNIGTRIVDAADGSTIKDFGPCGGVLRPSPDGRFFLRRSSVLDAQSGWELYDLTSGADAGQLRFGVSGYCDGSPDTLARIQALQGSASYPLDSFASLVFDPKRCAAHRAGVALAEPVLKVPPRLTVAPAERVVVSATDVTLSITAEDPGGLLGLEIERLGQGAPVLHEVVDESEDRSRARWSFTLDADERPTTLRIRALGRSGLLSRPHLVTVRD